MAVGGEGVAAKALTRTRVKVTGGVERDRVTQQGKSNCAGGSSVRSSVEVRLLSDARLALKLAAAWNWFLELSFTTGDLVMENVPPSPMTRSDELPNLDNLLRPTRNVRTARQRRSPAKVHTKTSDLEDEDSQPESGLLTPPSSQTQDEDMDPSRMLFSPPPEEVLRQGRNSVSALGIHNFQRLFALQRNERNASLCVAKEIYLHVHACQSDKSCSQLNQRLPGIPVA